MYQDTIGIIGGFGGYATLDFYRRFLEVFATGRERDYPHIIMDNDFTMPSRTKALYHGDDYDIVVQGIAASMKRLKEAGADHIILVCGTAHAFLEDVYQVYPEGKALVIDIIDALGEELLSGQITHAAVIAAEGTMKCGLYGKRLSGHGISIVQPDEAEYPEVRVFIEAVKQDHMTEHIAERFVDFLAALGEDNVILGCTEFPRLVKYTGRQSLDAGRRQQWDRIRFHDPLEAVLQKLPAVLK